MSDSKLVEYINQIENIEEQISEIKGDLKEKYLEIKGSGYDVKILKKVIKRRKDGKAKVEQEQTEIELYEAELQKAGVV